MQVLKYLPALLLLFMEVNGICRQLDDIYFHGIYGPLYLDEHVCENSTRADIQSYSRNSIRGDSRFTITNSNVSFLDPNLIQSSKNYIIILKFINCNIARVDQSGLSIYPKLYNLTIVDNQLESFNGKLIVARNARFRHFNLTGNNIRNLGDLCDGLPTVKTVVLKNNPLREIHGEHFRNCVNLEFLDLTNVSLASVADTSFASTRFLRELVIRNNVLDNLEVVHVPGLGNLTYLDASWNNFTAFSSDLFDYTPNLKILDLSFNNIRAVTYDKQPTNGSSILRTLKLNNNRLKTMNFSAFPVLADLDLSNNEIEEVPVDAFESLEELRHLRLANNLIKKISTIFSPLKNLIELDISGNDIAKVDNHVFVPLKNLEILNVESTKFEDIGMFVYTFQKLKTLYIPGNQKCDDLISLIRFSCTIREISCQTTSPSYKTTNIHGIPCVESPPTTDISREIVQPFPTAAPVVIPQQPSQLVQSMDFSNLTNYFYKQLEVTQQQTGEINRIGVVSVVFLLLLIVYLMYNMIYLNWARIRNRRSSKVSRLELLHSDEEAGH